MPKYQKDAKLEVWRDNPSYQDDAGSFHGTGSAKVGEVWANAKGTDYSEQYAMSAHWAEPLFKFTVTRPSWAIEIGDHVKYQGRYYAIRTINELTGKAGRDMVLICQQDTHWTPDEI